MPIRNTSTLRIGDLARISECQDVTVRYYEKEGLLPEPVRSSGNYRLYGPTHVERLQFIRYCRSLDMSLAEIRELLALRDNPANECGQINALLDRHIAQVQARIRELEHLQKHLLMLRKECGESRPVQACGILQGISHDIRCETCPTLA
ncbi:MAG: Cd(II)/Pb(II)-responsive transcriptional regulator [Alcaligenaceae bacterium]|nr:Cd(II)/Pb(II)-responsive transcriptional regulator [Alcaligenaceae bacterium]